MIDLTRFDLARFQDSASRAATLLRLLGNERRLMILCQLVDGERTVGALLPGVGLSQSALSQHLALLRAEGIVATRRTGQAVHYRLSDPAAARIIATLSDLFCPDQSLLPK